MQLIAISVNDGAQYPDNSFPKMKERARQKGFNVPYPYPYDESQQVARAYGAERTPEVFVFDKAPGLRYHGAIDDNYDEPVAVKDRYLRGALDAVAAGKTPAVTETKPVGCTIKWKAAA